MSSHKGWRHEWVKQSALPGWEKFYAQGVERTLEGVEEHGPHFLKGRDPMAELREELLDGLNYLNAAQRQRGEMLRLLDFILESSIAPNVRDRIVNFMRREFEEEELEPDLERDEWD